ELKKVVGTSQYYDRDTDPDMAQEGMTGLQEFMVKPERREQILERLEKTRKRIFG
ncbi:carbohydrate ABC transporter substrate-binding protein, partial [Mesorhizobium sp. M4B.F.Ca.ET.089.01.1.1]